MTKHKGITVRESKTYLDVETKDGILSFVIPSYGPGTYVSIGNHILEDKLQQPTMAQTVRLVYAAWQNPKKEHAPEILNRLDISKHSFTLTFNGLFYIPEEGLYIEDRPKIIDSKIVMNKDNLIQRLKAKDPSVRFIPFSESKKDIAKDPFVQALTGEEEADLVAQIAENYSNKPQIWHLDKSDVVHPTIRVATLYVEDKRLNIGGGNFTHDFGHAYAVEPKK